MPYQLDFNANMIQIMGGHFYIDILCGTDYKWVPLVPKTNGYFNQICHYSAIALTFGNLIDIYLLNVTTHRH